MGPETGLSRSLPGARPRGRRAHAPEGVDGGCDLSVGVLLGSTVPGQARALGAHGARPPCHAVGHRRRGATRCRVDARDAAAKP